MKKNNKSIVLFPVVSYLENLPEAKAKKTETFITLVLTFITLSFFIFFAINPTLSTITQLKKQLEDSQFVEKQLQDKITNVSLLQQQYTLLNSDIALALSAIPKTAETALFVAQIQQLARISHLKVASIQTYPVELNRKDAQAPTENALPKDYFSFVFSVSAEGSYEDIMRFLNNLSFFERIVTIDSLSLEKNDKQNDLRLNVRAKAYYKI